MIQLRQPLPDGPLDLIGDVHGEYDALRALVHHLGGDLEAGRVARPLVFVGDLVDRGPNSVAVLSAYRRLAEQGLAYCVLGNHELNLLREEEKEGNGWFRGAANDGFQYKTAGETTHVPFPCVAASEQDRAWIRTLIASLPIAVERDDLRVVHAAWFDDAFEQLGATGRVGDLAKKYDDHNDEVLRETRERAEQERKAFGNLKRLDMRPDRFLSAVAEDDEQTQNRNPIRRLTSGPEKKLQSMQDVRFQGGKWRFVRRDDWWDTYSHGAAVIVGHYWRSRIHDAGHEVQGWPAKSASHWLGERGNVFCVDYSVGRRYRERHENRTSGFHGGLAAIRWPERTLVFDDDPTPRVTQGFEQP